MLKDKTIKVFDTSVLSKGDFIMVARVSREDDGEKAISSYSVNCLISNVDENYITYRDCSGNTHIISVEDVINGSKVIVGHSSKLDYTIG